MTCKPRRPGVDSSEADARDGCAGRMIPQSILDPAGRLFVVSGGIGGDRLPETSRRRRIGKMRRRGAVLLGPGRCARRPTNADGAGARSRAHDSIT